MVASAHQWLCLARCETANNLATPLPTGTPVVATYIPAFSDWRTSAALPFAEAAGIVGLRGSLTNCSLRSCAAVCRSAAGVQAQMHNGGRPMRVAAYLFASARQQCVACTFPLQLKLGAIDLGGLPAASDRTRTVQPAVALCELDAAGKLAPAGIYGSHEPAVGLFRRKHPTSARAKRNYRLRQICKRPVAFGPSRCRASGAQENGAYDVPPSTAAIQAVRAR